MKNTGLGDLTASKWARLIFIFLGTGIILLAPQRYLFKPAYDDSRMDLIKMEKKLKYIGRNVPRLEKALSKPAGRKSREIRNLKMQREKLLQQKARLNRLKNKLAPKVASLKIKVQFLNVLIYLVLGLTILSLLFFLKLCFAKSKRSVAHILSGSLWTTAPSLFFLLIIVYFVRTTPPGTVAFTGFECTVPLVLFGISVIITAIFIPARAARSFGSDSWRFDETKFGRIVTRISRVMTSVLFISMGSHAIEQKPDGEVALSTKKLFRHGFWILLFIGIGWSALGIFLGNFVRINYLLTSFAMSGWYVLWTILITTAVLLLCFRTWRSGFLSKLFPKLHTFNCPECRREHRYGWVPRSFAQSLFMQNVCGNCGCVMNHLGEKVDSKIRSGHVFKLLAITVPATLVSIIISIFITAFGWNLIGKISFASAKKDLRRAGFSYTHPSNKPKPADKDNAVYWFTEAGNSLEKSLKSVSKVEFYKKDTEKEFLSSFLNKALKDGITGQELAYAKKLVKKHRKSLDLFRIGASKKAVHWGTDWNKPHYEIRIPKFPSFIQLGKLVSIKAVVEAKEGNVRRSAETIKSGLFFASVSGTEPWLLPKMIEIVLYDISLRAAQFNFSKIPLSEMKRLWNPYLKPDKIPSGFRKTMQFELLGGAEWLTQLGWSDKRFETMEFESMGTVYWPFLKLDIASFYRAVKYILKALKLPYSEHKSGLEKAEENFRKTVWILGQVTHPRFTDLYSRALATSANMCLAKTAMAARSYKQKKGRWPEAVWELAATAGGPEKQEFLNDPFTGGKLRLRKYKSGIIIYSIGPDLIDDQGAPWDKSDRKGDLTWFLR